MSLVFKSSPKERKTPNVKIVLLKQVGTPKNIYSFAENNTNIQIQQQKPKEKTKINNISIAYLSSIIQEQRSNVQQSINFQEEDRSSILITQGKTIKKSLQQINHFRKTRKSLQTENHLNSIVKCRRNTQKIQKSMNKQINRLFQEKKILPIEDIYMRKKVITFSASNKQDLSKDFEQFIVNKAQPQSKSDETNLLVSTQCKRYGDDLGLSAKKHRKRYIYSKVHKQKARVISDEFEDRPQKTQKSRQRSKTNVVNLKELMHNFRSIQNFDWAKLQHKYTHIYNSCDTAGF